MRSTLKTMVAGFLILAGAAQAQVLVGTYDFVVQGSGTGMTRDVALQSAVSMARTNCGSNAMLAGYGNVRYVGNYGSSWAYVDGYCKRRGGSAHAENTIEGDVIGGKAVASNAMPTRATVSLVGERSAR